MSILSARFPEEDLLMSMSLFKVSLIMQIVSVQPLLEDCSVIKIVFNSKIFIDRLSDKEREAKKDRQNQFFLGFYFDNLYYPIGTSGRLQFQIKKFINYRLQKIKQERRIHPERLLQRKRQLQQIQQYQRTRRQQQNQRIQMEREYHEWVRIQRIQKIQQEEKRRILQYEMQLKLQQQQMIRQQKMREFQAIFSQNHNQNYYYPAFLQNPEPQFWSQPQIDHFGNNNEYHRTNYLPTNYEQSIAMQQGIQNNQNINRRIIQNTQPNPNTSSEFFENHLLQNQQQNQEGPYQNMIPGESNFQAIHDNYIPQKMQIQSDTDTDEQIQRMFPGMQRMDNKERPHQDTIPRESNFQGTNQNSNGQGLRIQNTTQDINHRK